MKPRQNDNGWARRRFLAGVIWATGASWLHAGRALSGTSEAVEVGGTVVVKRAGFRPATVVVQTGTRVTWTNHDAVPHTVVNTEQQFRSPILDSDQRFSHTFDAPGSYRYFCSLHPKMTGRIVVE